MKNITYTKLIEACDDNITFYTHHIEILREKINSIEKVKNFLKTIDSKAKFDDFNEIEQIINVNAFLAIVLLDLSVVLKNLYSVQTDWEKAFFIKNGFLIIHESCRKLNPKKGHPYIKQKIFSEYKSLKSDYGKVLKSISEFEKRDIYKKIESVRHTIAGHIEKNLKKHYDLTNELNHEETALVINDFIIILNQFLKITTDYVNAANRVKAIKPLSENEAEQLNILRNILKI